MNKLEKLILGTVQFGLNYGISNTNGKPSKTEVFEILESAKNAGITTLDTAKAYGNAIDIIGDFHQSTNFKFNIITKYKSENELNIWDSLKDDLDKLHISKYDCVMLHNSKDLTNEDTIITLKKLKSNNIASKIGVSIYSNNDIDEQYFDLLDTIQLPYNLLDNDNLRKNYIKQLNQSNIDVHTRSAFLQGLFFIKNNENMSEKMKPLFKYLDKINAIIYSHHLTIETLALNYCLQNEFIQKVVFGVNSLDELNRNLELISIPVKASIFEEINSIFVNEIELLNPSNWQ